MSTHVVLLFEPDRLSQEIEPSIASELERASYEVIEAHNLSTATALLSVNRRLEAVVIDTASDQIGAELVHSVSAVRPGLPLLTAASKEVPAPADGQAGHDTAVFISALEGLL